MPFRRLRRDINEDARDVARALVDTPEFERSRDKRKKGEMRFAHLKTHHRFERMRLRGLSGARDGRLLSDDYAMRAASVATYEYRCDAQSVPRRRLLGVAPYNPPP
jgi:hypothetical protein